MTHYNLYLQVRAEHTTLLHEVIQSEFITNPLQLSFYKGWWCVPNLGMDAITEIIQLLNMKGIDLINYKTVGIDLSNIY